MNASAKSLPNRLSEFDVLRSLAILGVIIIHTMAALEVAPESGSLTYFLVVFIDQSQRFCVPAFLIISGFFLTFNPRNDRHPAQVLQKRLSRIIPPYLIWSLIWELIPVLSGSKEFNILKILQALLSGSAAYPYYFIILIIQCYFLWWLVAHFKLENYRLLIPLSLIFQGITTFLFYLILIGQLPDAFLKSKLIFCWSFYFIIGMYLGRNYDNVIRLSGRYKKPLALLTGLALGFSVLEFFWFSSLDIVSNIGAKAAFFWKLSAQVYALSFSVLVLHHYQTHPLKNKRIALLFNRLAQYSFPIYLIHAHILDGAMQFVQQGFGGNSFVSFLILGGIDLVVSFACVYFCCMILPTKYQQSVLGIS